MKTIKYFFITLILISLQFSFAQDKKFIGAKGCSACHKGEKGKMIYEQWVSTKHADAYKTLLGQKSKDIGKKLGLKTDPSDAEECLVCHATGYMPGELRQPTAKKEEGVTCEACHGAGSLYKTKHGKEKTEEGKKLGLLLADNDSKVCTKCHNSKSPTYVSFDYKKDWKKIEHKKK